VLQGPRIVGDGFRAAGQEDGAGESRRDEPAARNQSLFREVNEPVAELNQTFEQLTPYGGWAC
jgi:hypothetical protein